jgi:hypothetical protein
MVFEVLLVKSLLKLSRKTFFAEALEFKNKSLQYSQIDYSYNAL